MIIRIYEPDGREVATPTVFLDLNKVEASHVEPAKCGYSVSFDLEDGKSVSSCYFHKREEADEFVKLTNDIYIGKLPPKQAEVFIASHHFAR